MKKGKKSGNQLGNSPYLKKLLNRIVEEETKLIKDLAKEITKNIPDKSYYSLDRAEVLTRNLSQMVLVQHILNCLEVEGR